MITLRKSSERGYFDHGWLKTYHTFSFAEYQDPNFMGFRSLRVINEDFVAAGMGFGTHPHRDMEIITYILEGELEHKDSMGNGSVIRPGDVQKMSAGNGVTHSEFNPSKTNPVHLLQIWILPSEKNLKPMYAQEKYSLEQRKNKLCLVASGRRSHKVPISQDVDLYASVLDKNQTIQFELAKEGFGWIQIAKGSLEINNQILGAGDGAALTNESRLTLKAMSDSEFLLFELN